MQYQHIPDSAMAVTTEVGLHGESSQTGRVRFFMCILLSRALLTLACSGICISLFFVLLFIWRLRRPLIGRARSLILTFSLLYMISQWARVSGGFLASFVHSFLSLLFSLLCRLTPFSGCDIPSLNYFFITLQHL